MSTVKMLQPTSVDAYLEEEQLSTVRHELVGWQSYAMTGASNVHNLLAGNLYSSLRAWIKKPCQVCMSDMKVSVDDNFYYPDVVVACQTSPAPFYYMTTPVLIAEVLSASTEIRDRLEKRLAYQRLNSLQEYVLISQDMAHIEIYRRTSEGWELESCGIGDVIQLPGGTILQPPILHHRRNPINTPFVEFAAGA